VIQPMKGWGFTGSQPALVKVIAVCQDQVSGGIALGL